jgi:hypothetical protein
MGKTSTPIMPRNLPTTQLMDEVQFKNNGKEIHMLKK